MAITPANDSIIRKHPAENPNKARLKIGENLYKLEQLKIDLMLCDDKDKARDIKDGIAVLEKRNGYLKEIVEDK